MPSGYRSGGVDFDDLFDPFVTGTPPPPTGYRVAGVDLAGRYAPLVYGTQRADVGYRIAGGADVATLWAAKGTASYVSETAGLPVSISAIRISTAPITATASFSMFRDGTTTWSQPPGSASSWYPGGGAGVGDSYEVIFDALSGAGGTLTGSALSTWLPLSATQGVTLSVTRTTTGASEGTRDVQVRIRRIGTVTVLATRVVAMYVRAEIS